MSLLYGLIGNDAFGGGFTLFSLAYFALFLISFSLSVVDENFIVQSIWAGIALCGYLALCLYIVMLGFSWKFRHAVVLGRDPASGRTSLIDLPTLLASSRRFSDAWRRPFVVSFFLAFKKFDLKPARAFNRRQLLIFVPLLLLAFAASLGVTYLVQKSSAYGEANFIILKGPASVENRVSRGN